MGYLVNIVKATAFLLLIPFVAFFTAILCCLRNFIPSVVGGIQSYDIEIKPIQSKCHTNYTLVIPSMPIAIFMGLAIRVWWKERNNG